VKPSPFRNTFALPDPIPTFFAFGAFHPTLHVVSTFFQRAQNVVQFCEKQQTWELFVLTHQAQLSVQLYCETDFSIRYQTNLTFETSNLLHFASSAKI
jgi:hypothetical protein